MEERQKALAYYCEKLEARGMEFDVHDWVLFERELRADFDNDMAEQAFIGRIHEAYDKGQNIRHKRKKLTKSQNGASDEDAPMFEGSSCGVGADVAVISTSGSNGARLAEVKDASVDPSTAKSTKDVEGKLQWGSTSRYMPLLCTRPKPDDAKDISPAPPSVRDEIEHQPAPSNGHQPPADQRHKSGPAVPRGSSVRKNGQTRAPKSHNATKMSMLSPAYAGVRKIKGDRRTSPSRGAGIEAEANASHPTQTAASEHAENDNGSTVDNQSQGTDTHLATSMAQQALQLMGDEEATSRTHELDADVQYVAELEASPVADAIAESERQSEEDAASETYLKMFDIEPRCSKKPTSSQASDDHLEEHEPPEASAFETEYSPQDDVDTKYLYQVAAPLQKWMDSMKPGKAKSSPLQKSISHEDHESKGPIASSGTLRIYAKAVENSLRTMERLMKANKLSKVNPRIWLKMQDNPLLMPRSRFLGYEIAAKFQIDVSGPSNLPQTHQN